MQDLYQKVLTFYERLRSDYSSRDDAIIARYKKVSGKQLWSAEDEEYLRQSKRPLVATNLFFPLFLFLVGTQRQSRSAMKAVPTVIGDEATADIMTSLMFWNYNKTMFEYEFSKQFIHSIIGGIGWGHSHFDYVKGHWVYRAYDPLRIRFDRQTKSATFRDCKYLQDTQWLSAEEIYSLVGDDKTLAEVKYRLEELEPKEGNRSAYYNKAYSGGWRWDTTSDRYKDDYIDYKEGRYRVIDHHEQRSINKTVLINTENPSKYIDLTGSNPKQIASIKKEYPAFEEVTIDKTEFWHTIINPATLMVLRDEPYRVQTGSYHWIPMICYDIVPSIDESVGVFDNIENLVDSYNKRESVILEYLIDTVGGNWLISDTTYNLFKEDYLSNKKRSFRRYSSVDRNIPRRETPPPIPEGLWRYATDELRKTEKITGITANMRGSQENSQETGVLYRQRVQQSEVMLTALFDNVKLAQKLSAMSCIKHIQDGMTEEQTYRLLDRNDNAQWIEINKKTIDGVLNDVTTGEYDIEIDETRPSVTARQVALAEAMELTKSGMPPQLIAWDLIVDSTGVANKNEWRDRIRSYFKKMGIDIADPSQIYASPDAMNKQLSMQNPQMANSGQALADMQGAMQQMNVQIPNQNQLQI